MDRDQGNETLSKNIKSNSFPQFSPNLFLGSADTQAELQIALQAIHTGDLLTAQVSLLKLHHSNPSDETITVKFAEVLALLGRTAEATIVLKRSLKSAPNSFELNLSLAKVLVCSEVYSSEGTKYASRALELNSHSATATVIKSKSLRREFRSREALKLLLTQLHKVEDRNEVTKELAELYRSIGDLVRERNALEVLSQSEPTALEVSERIRALDDAVKELKSAEPFPRVTVVIPTCSGRRHLNGMLESLDRQMYPHFDIIVIDDCSEEDLSETFQRERPDILVYRLDKRLGYSESCNIGMDLSSSEFVAFLNDDTSVDRLWLFSLVSRLAQDKKTAVVTSKTLFWERFVPIHIEVSEPVKILRKNLLDSISSYPKVFADKHSEVDGIERNWRISDRLRLLVPILDRPIHLNFIRLEADGLSPISIVLKIGNREIHKTLREKAASVEIDLLNEESESVDVLNNAGSELTLTGEASDIGLGWPDRGQYEKVRDITAFCGCSFMIRRSSLGDRPLFCAEFEAYWEDTELSVRLRKSGFRLVYEPKSIVRHRHASTSLENSPFFWTHVVRNEFLFNLIHFTRELAESKLRGRLRSITVDQGNSILAKQIREKIEADLSGDVLNRVYSRRKKVLKFGIYNKYWSTYGGGERYALEIAKVLEKYGVVELIGNEDNFSVCELSNRFGIQLKRTRKVVEYNISDLSRSYDVFFNGTHGSMLIPLSKKSVYITSFPDVALTKGKESALAFYNSIWANSFYSARFIKGRWKRIPNVVYPGCMRPVGSGAKCNTKEKLFIAVGRFFTSGHCKKQLEIVRAFKRFKSQSPDQSAGWRLMLVGGIQDMDYYNRVANECTEPEIVLRGEVTSEELRDLYRQAAYIVHATGLGEDIRTHPERCEHFGISVIEAMSFGCVPIVFKAGGPLEITKGAIGYHFLSSDQLCAALSSAARAFNLSTREYIKAHESSVARASDFSPSKIFYGMEQTLLSTFPEINDNYSTDIVYHQGFIE